MARTLTRVADAIATLRAAGHTVTRTSKCDAARRYGCQTCLYVIDGRGVNVGRLRELALVAKTADAAAVIAARTAPHPLTVRAIALKAAETHRAACLAANGADADGMHAAAVDAVAELAAFDAAFASR